MNTLLIIYLALVGVHLVTDVACCIIARSRFNPLLMLTFAVAWPVSWPAISIMASVMLMKLKDAGLVPETNGGAK